MDVLRNRNCAFAQGGTTRSHGSSRAERHRAPAVCGADLLPRALWPFARVGCSVVDYCCWKCFDDKFLSLQIKQTGTVATCLLCDTRRKCFDTDALRKFFEPLIGLYSDIEGFMPLDSLKEGAGEHPTLAEKLNDDWQLFEDSDVAERFLRACCEPYHPKHNPDTDTFDPDRLVDDEELYFEDKYYETQRLSELWNELKVELSTKNRFFAGVKVVAQIRDALPSASTVLKPSQKLYRVRACEHEVPHKPAKMGAPPASLATAGRANPPGIPYLYLASTPETAVSEVRPHVGDCLCIGTFKLKRALTVIDLREPYIRSPFEVGENLGQVLRVMGFLRELGRELSRPISPHRRDREYLVTQYLCELVKTSGFDGVLYRSGLGDGFNVALFGTAAGRCIDVKTATVRKVSIELSK